MTVMSCCASCGVAENDEVKLKKCNGCFLVKYCGVKCQKVHRKQHKRECKKRTAELHDELLFKQPESTHLGDCPICFLPLSLDITKNAMKSCCSKIICNGCNFANQNREMEMRLEKKCPFCREPLCRSMKEVAKLRMKRVETNDPIALCVEGEKHYERGDYRSAFDYWTKAAKLGDAEAHCRLANLYLFGKGVDKDEEKEIHQFEQAAIAGHPLARYELGAYEWNKGNDKRAVKHWIISATQGENKSTKALMDAFRDGLVSKEKLAVTLRAYQAALDATKSPQRQAAKDAIEAEEFRRVS